MSQERKILVAKRRTERSNFANFGNGAKVVKNDHSFVKKTVKRVLPTPKCKKNLAQERLKRLRKKINDDTPVPDIVSCQRKSSDNKKSVDSPASIETFENVFTKDVLEEDFTMCSDVEMLDCSDMSDGVNVSSSQFILTENTTSQNIVQVIVLV